MKHLDFFGLNEEPFRMTPDRDYFFPSAQHTSISEVVHYGLEQGEGFLVILGEVGTGKTMLLRLLTARLSEKFTTALLISPNLTPKQLLQAILHDINVEITGQESTVKLLHTLNDYLSELYSSGRRLVLIIDEAQNLPVESIEQLRILSNFETDKDKLLQIILVGQPELKTIIDSNELRQLKQRITITENLEPLTLHEMADYIAFRLNKAGRGDLRLNNGGNKTVFRFTGGTPRLVNKLMGRALLVAFADRKQSIDKKIIQYAAKSLEMTPIRNWLQWFN
ncbi:MAG: AAA family ATPase [Desulfobulbaceae bacterium]|uniref:AAA family ATPase n=1 Tax=Candidatus Desulfobia pelagia TaxID=2841692 RepID=A0A8J6NF75_9BACT|nr:AAA family ATPase [Candidatus Desulfobia pelagia]